jgi:NAD(P)-dependent dehydrogenase (short-subunit alcohol dehydrogenase family)
VDDNTQFAQQFVGNPFIAGLVADGGFLLVYSRAEPLQRPAGKGEVHMRSVVITGTSTGIGHGSAKVLLAHGFRVFGSVRQQADADRLQAEFGANFTPLLFDVTDEAAVNAAADQVRAALGGETLAGLVNNAGISVAGPFIDLSVADFRRQFDANVIGPIIATKAFTPLLGADPSMKGPRGRIVMISSVAGQHGNPLGSPYSASKHALEGLSESLRREFMLFGIDVIVIGPGAVKTPIWGKTGRTDLSGHRDSPFLPAREKVRAYAANLAASGLPPERLGELVHQVLTMPQPKVRYEITPEPLRMFLMRNLPKRMIDRMIAKRFALLPKEDGGKA